MSEQEKAALAAMMANVDLSTFQHRDMPNPYLSAFHQTNRQLMAPLLRLMAPSYQAPPSVPWWMNQTGREQVSMDASIPVGTTAGTATNTGAWGDIEAQAAKDQKIVDELGDFSKKVMDSPLIGK